jgi:hypothetical protein
MNAECNAFHPVKDIIKGFKPLCNVFIMYMYIHEVEEDKTLKVVSSFLTVLF